MTQLSNPQNVLSRFNTPMFSTPNRFSNPKNTSSMEELIRKLGGSVSIPAVSIPSVSIASDPTIASAPTVSGVSTATIPKASVASTSSSSSPTSSPIEDMVGSVRKGKVSEAKASISDDNKEAVPIESAYSEVLVEGIGRFLIDDTISLDKTKIPFPLFYTGLTFTSKASKKSVIESMPVAISVNNTKYVFRNNEWKLSSHTLSKLQLKKLNEFTKNVEPYNYAEGFESLPEEIKVLFGDYSALAGKKVI